MESNNVRVVNLSGYQTPVVTEVYNRDWVEYGEDNDYFKKLIDNYLGSPTNSRFEIFYGECIKHLFKTLTNIVLNLIENMAILKIQQPFKENVSKIFLKSLSYFHNKITNVFDFF